MFEKSFEGVKPSMEQFRSNSELLLKVGQMFSDILKRDKEATQRAIQEASQ